MERSCVFPVTFSMVNRQETNSSHLTLALVMQPQRSPVIICSNTSGTAHGAPLFSKMSTNKATCGGVMPSRGPLFSESMGWHLRRCSLQQNLNSLQSLRAGLHMFKATSFGEASYDFLFLQSNLALPQALQAHWILTLL